MRAALQRIWHCPRRWWYVVGALAVIILAAGLSVLIGGYVDQRRHTDQLILDQSETNQLFIECAITFALANDPPQCAEVKADLAADGIPLTPNQAAQQDPRKSPAVALILCEVAAATDRPVPEGVTCPAPLPAP